MNFVLDSSVALTWLMPETNPEGVDYACQTLHAMKESLAIVPSLFCLEVSNVLAILETKGLPEADASRFIALLGGLNIETDQVTSVSVVSDTLNLSRRYKLSAYDAAYLELAMRNGIPLATLNQNLKHAASTAGVQIFGIQIELIAQT